MHARGRIAAAATAAAAALATAAYATLVEPRRLRVRRRTLRLPNWPRALDGLTVAVIADLHAGAPQIDESALRKLVARVNETRPDLVVLLGDHVDDDHHLGDEIPPERVAACLGHLEAPRGVVAVLGNHDWLAGGHRVADALRANHITVLENDATRAGPGLSVAGVGDATERVADPHRALEAIQDPDAAVLLLTHDPDVFPRVPTRPALTLAGHTHGGQIDIPGARRAWIPSRFGARYATRTHVVEDGRHLLLSPGVGTSGWPVRLAARPEIPIVTLRPAGTLQSRPWISRSSSPAPPDRCPARGEACPRP